MILETKRCLMREWKTSDAEMLYKYASHPDIGYAAGWNAHTSIENSREIIKNVLSLPETYAILLKKLGNVVGSIGLKIGKYSNKNIQDNEAEIGYWIGVPFWGQGLVPECLSEILKYGFNELGLTKIYGAYFDDNIRSKKVLEKCNFKYSHTIHNATCAIKELFRTEHIMFLTKDKFFGNTFA